MGPARVASSHVWNIRIAATKIKFSARPRRLQGGEFDVLELKAHFEGMFAVNFGEVVGDLDCGSDFIGRQEGVASQSLQPVDSEGGKPAVFTLLGDTLDAELCGNAA